MKIIQCDQGTPEWLAARAGIATASCFADVMAAVKSGEAADRRNYRAKLVVERLTGKPVATYQNAAMRQGTEREPDARMAYMVKTGAIVEQVGLCRHDDLECAASPDGLVDTDGGFEAKCPELAAHLRYLQLPIGTAPPEYVWQIQGGMWVTDRQWWDFASWNPDFPENLQLVIRRIKRDDAAIKRLADEISKFMQEVRDETDRILNLRLAA